MKYIIHLIAVEPGNAEAIQLDTHTFEGDEESATNYAGYIAGVEQAKRRKFKQGHKHQRVAYILHESKEVSTTENDGQ